MPWLEPECGAKCRSRSHAQEFSAAVSKGSLKEIQACSRLCHNSGLYCDLQGRSALHVAAACGKCDVIEWLMEKKNGDVTRKDTESGWTALHRAIFYGQLVAARLLIQYHSDLYTRDKEGLGPLDLAMKDRPEHINFSKTDPNEVFSWGDNLNFTLGHMSEHHRSAPEHLDVFRKLGISIKQVVMCKYHTVFLTQSGQVYTCGHGQGGRLGHDNEATCLVPKLVKYLKDEICVTVAASRDFTFFLTESGSVFSCGMNENHQLGQVPPPEKCLVPRMVSAKQMKGHTIVDVCVGRFHTVLQTRDAILTFGLNAGQLGHPKMKEQQVVSQPRLVTWLSQKDVSVIKVACSDAATVVLTTKGDIYVLHEYQCRKIASNRPEIKGIQVSGGHLDHRDSQVLREKGGSELIISILTASNRVFIWRSSSPSLKRAHWQIKRQLFVVECVLTASHLAIVTTDGEAFMGTLSTKASQTKDTQHNNKDDQFGKTTLLDLLLDDDVEEVQVHRIPYVHRATYITADSKGRNYALLQSLHNISLTEIPTVSSSEMCESFSKLLEEVDEYDTIHDILLQVDGRTWPAHQFILLNRCGNFVNFLNKTDQTDLSSDCPVVKVPGIQPQIFDQLLQFVYTDTCDLLTIGAKVDLTSFTRHSENIFHMELEEEDPREKESSSRKMSAFEVHQKNKNKGDKSASDHVDKATTSVNPIKLLQDAGKRFGVKGLAKRLEAVKCSKGTIVAVGKHLQKPKLRFERDRFRDSKWELYDVCIQSDDGVEYLAHKCVLVARLEYFHSMLASGWMETSSSTALTLPIPGDIMAVLLDFLYTDESPVVQNCQNVELLCNVLVVADQMLVTQLKELCEAALTPLITLKNVAQLLEFTSLYNATQLRKTCQQYIALNLGSLLETRSLDVLSDSVMLDLIQSYRDSIPNMSRRIITPWEEGPTRAFLESLVSDERETTPASGESVSKKQKSRKRRNRTKSSSDEVEKSGGRGSRRTSERQLSVSSDVSVKSEEDLMEVVESLETAGDTDTTIKETVEPTSSPSVPTPLRVNVKGGPWGVQSPTKGLTSPTVWPQSAGDQSPQSPTESFSLRAVMKEEGSAAPTTKPSNNKKRFSWKEVKKQQQVENQTKAGKTSKKMEAVAQPPVSVDQESSKSHCPWGGVSQVVQSFRSLMVADEVLAKPPPSLPSKPSLTTSTKPATLPPSVNWGLPQSHIKKKSLAVAIDKGNKSEEQTTQQSPRSPENPWQMMDMAQSPPTPSFSFSDIMQDEKERTDVLNKNFNKPLSLIQMEEQAIQELLVHYKAADRVTERITVERVSRVSATPIWKRERLQSS